MLTLHEESAIEDEILEFLMADETFSNLSIQSTSLVKQSSESLSFVIQVSGNDVSVSGLASAFQNSVIVNGDILVDNISKNYILGGSGGFFAQDSLEGVTSCLPSIQSSSLSVDLYNTVDRNLNETEMPALEEVFFSYVSDKLLSDDMYMINLTLSDQFKIENRLLMSYRNQNIEITAFAYANNSNDFGSTFSKLFDSSEERNDFIDAVNDVDDLKEYFSESTSMSSVSIIDTYLSLPSSEPSFQPSMKSSFEQSIKPSVSPTAVGAAVLASVGAAAVS